MGGLRLREHCSVPIMCSLPCCTLPTTQEAAPVIIIIPVWQARKLRLSEVEPLPKAVKLGFELGALRSPHFSQDHDGGKMGD